MGQLYLRQAMVQVLEEAGGWMDRDELARRIADQDLYRRKDGSWAPSDQMRLRAHKRPDLFARAATRAAPVSAFATGARRWQPTPK